MEFKTNLYEENACHAVIKDFAEADQAHCAALYVQVFRQASWDEIWQEELVQANIRCMMARKIFLGLTAWYENQAVGYLLRYCIHEMFPS